MPVPESVQTGYCTCGCDETSSAIFVPAPQTVNHLFPPTVRRGELSFDLSEVADSVTNAHGEFPF